ncbi:NUDIX hydrolase [Bacillus daqingensis]|uniref:NUDIX hydrolase n=1 Tax=Bacillus daqingensis TaxID=872396 RepID=A0ABV9NS98_9BACI
MQLTWTASSSIPQDKTITSAHGFCFQHDELLLVKLQHRGWDFPGGHLEQEETPEACVKREVVEEGYVKGNLRLIGFVTVDHTHNPNWQENGRYPKIGCQLFYRMDITERMPFRGLHESEDRMFIEPAQIDAYYHSWNPVYQAILEEALSN